MHELVEGVEIITNKVLRNIRYLVSNAIKAKVLSHLSGLACGGGSESSLHEAMLVGFALLVVKDKETKFAFGILLPILKARVDIQLIAFAFHELTNFGDVVGIGLGAVLIVLGSNKELNLYACGNIVRSQRIIIRATGGQVLAPFNMDDAFCTLGGEERYEDFVSGFNWARHFCGLRNVASFV